jgi:hypothetical protein
VDFVGWPLESWKLRNIAFQSVLPRRLRRLADENRCRRGYDLTHAQGAMVDGADHSGRELLTGRAISVPFARERTVIKGQER